LDLAAFRAHRESLGIAAVGWREMLAMVRSCFASGRMTLTEADDQLIVACRYTIGSEVELEGRFTLDRVEDDPFSDAASSPHALDAPQQLLAHMLFAVFANTAANDSATIEPLQQQIASLRSELSSAQSTASSLRIENSQLQSERATWLGGSATSSSSNGPSQGSFDSADPNRSPTAGSKRKPPPKPKNMSVLNPNSKRRKMGGIKIE
jgi:hypothetical protein